MIIHLACSQSLSTRAVKGYACSVLTSMCETKLFIDTKFEKLEMKGRVSHANTRSQTCTPVDGRTFALQDCRDQCPDHPP